MYSIMVKKQCQAMKSVSSLFVYSRLFLFACMTLFSSACFAHHNRTPAPANLPWQGQFDRIFVQNLPHPWTLAQLNHRLSVPGIAISAHHLHWDGQKGSFMDVDVVNDRVVHMYIKTPDGENLELRGP